jgi:molybdenum cofactor biosynthesis protein MoaC
VFPLVQRNKLTKGDVLSTAQLSGIMAAKHTSTLIPLCHPILLSKVDVKCELQPDTHTVLVTAMARTVGPTGVEMEALTAAAVAGLTIYDMCKAASKDIVISQLQLIGKTGGKSGTYQRSP